MAWPVPTLKDTDESAQQVERVEQVVSGFIKPVTHLQKQPRDKPSVRCRELQLHDEFREELRSHERTSGSYDVMKIFQRKKEKFLNGDIVPFRK